MSRYEFVRGTSNKFWEISLDRSASKLLTRWGRIGSTGQETTKRFRTSDDAQAAHDALIREKTGKGYVLVGGPSVASKPRSVGARSRPKPPPAPVAPATPKSAKYEAIRAKRPLIDAKGKLISRAYAEACWLLRGSTKRPSPELTADSLEFLLAHYDTLAAKGGYWFREEFMNKLKRTHRAAKHPWLVPTLREALSWLPAHAAVRARVTAFLEREAPGGPTTPGPDEGEEAELLRAIANAPTSDGPRFVYADWLLERGMPFGEFVQASLAVEQAPRGSARWFKLEDAAEQLERHALRWWGPLRTAVPHVGFRRGVVTGLSVQAARLPAIFQQLVERAPLAHVSIDGLAKSRWRLFGPVLRCPLGTLHGLGISDEMTDERLVELAGAPALAGLKRLWVHGAFTDAGAGEVVRSPRLQKSLVTLSLVDVDRPEQGVRLSAETARSIAVSQPQLKALSLGLNNLGELEPLFKHAHLEELVLRLDSFTQADFDAFLASPLARRLVLLYLEADAGKLSGATLKRLKVLPALRYHAVRIGRESIARTIPTKPVAGLEFDVLEEWLLDGYSSV